MNGEQGDMHTDSEDNPIAHETTYQRKRKLSHRIEERQAKVRLTDSRRTQIQQQPPPDEDPGGNTDT